MKAAIAHIYKIKRKKEKNAQALQDERKRIKLVQCIMKFIFLDLGHT